MADKMTNSNARWQVLRSEIVYDGSPFIQVEMETVRLPDGRIIDDFHQVLLPDFVIGVPVLEDGTILTQWQYKHGARCHSLTFPAGHIEGGEAAKDAMARELLEETGYTFQHITDLGSYSVNGNQGCAEAHLFVMMGCRQTSLPDHDDLEDWDIRFMSPSEIDAAVQNKDLAILPHLAVWLAAQPHLSSHGCL